MAISSATMTVTLTESVTLNGSVRGSTNTLTIDSIKYVEERTVTVPSAAEQVIINIGDNIGPGRFVEGSVKYIRITNKDTTNHITLTFKNQNDDEFAVKLDKGQSFIYNGDADGVEDTMDAIDGTGITLSLGCLVNVVALADTADCDIELMVACV
jgi:hypothetical protein